MDIKKVSDEIEKKINELEIAKKHLSERGEKKALTSANYDKALAVMIIKIKNGYEVELEGQKVKDVPATIMEKIAKGICFQEKLDMEKADAEYKSLITYINTVESQLNGWQSINKYLDSK